jgi:uncharacterized protein (TIGR02231 family)
VTDTQPGVASAAPAAPATNAPIVAVTVFPDRARVTRRRQVVLAAGEHRIVFDDLPAALDEDSVRVAGSGPATVLGVEVSWRFPARASDEATAELRRQVAAAGAQLAAIEDEDAVAAARLDFYAGLAHRATRSYAVALAAGETDPARVAELADAFAAQQATVREQRRVLARRRDEAREEVEARQRAVDARQARAQPDHRAVTVDLRVDAIDQTAQVVLELSYVVTSAWWHSAYDVRLEPAGSGHSLSLSWFGLVTQQTGEDWPECDLRLSTARPSGAVSVPELDPWFLDRLRPAPPIPAAMPAQTLGGSAPMMARSVGFAAADGVAVRESVAAVEPGVTAATYRPARAVAVPADGTAHRATVAVLRLEAKLDYVTAPVRAAEAHLRATVVNTSEHTLPAGRAAVFHASEFGGSAQLAVWAPGEEVELALGVDDRIRVERELVRRGATKAVLGAARRRDAQHRIRVTNHTPARARVTVLDQVPVSRDEGIVVREQRLDPVPTGRTDLGVLTWLVDLAPGETKEIHVGVRVESAKGVEVLGWRE